MVTNEQIELSTLEGPKVGNCFHSALVSLCDMHGVVCTVQFMPNNLHSDSDHAFFCSFFYTFSKGIYTVKELFYYL